MTRIDRSAPLTFNQTRLLAALVSLILSWLSFYFDDLINRDGVMYMEMVEAYMSGGLGAMSKIFDWPFFTLVVAWVSKLLSLQPELTASTLNSLLFVVYTDALILISKRILPSQQQIFIATILILGFYSINEYRDYIIRDIGYWAFCSLALYQLLRFIENAELKSAILWQVFAIFALLFRVEGLVLLLTLPLFVLLTHPSKVGVKKFLLLNSLFIPVMLTASLAALSMNGWVDAFDKLSSYQKYMNTEALELKFDRKATILEKEILSPFSADYSALILFSGLLTMLISKLLEGVSIGYILLLGLAWWQKKRLVISRHSGLLLWFISINVVILMAFLFKQYFVVSRYCIMAVTGIFLLILPTLTSFIDDCWQKKCHWLSAVTAFLVLAGIVDTFHTTSSKAYIKETAIWASYHLQSEDKLLTDDEFIQYYLKREQTPVSITYRPKGLVNYQRFDYLLVLEKGRPYQFKPVNGVQLELVYQQKNKRNDKASIYKVIHDAG